MGLQIAADMVTKRDPHCPTDEGMARYKQALGRRMLIVTVVWKTLTTHCHVPRLLCPPSITQAVKMFANWVTVITVRAPPPHEMEYDNDPQTWKGANV
jgi:hypothetical protein